MQMEMLETVKVALKVECGPVVLHEKPVTRILHQPTRVGLCVQPMHGKAVNPKLLKRRRQVLQKKSLFKVRAVEGHAEKALEVRERSQVQIAARVVSKMDSANASAR